MSSHATLPSTVFGGMSIESSSSFANERIRQRAPRQQSTERQEKKIKNNIDNKSNESTKSPSTSTEHSCAQFVPTRGQETENNMLSRMLESASQAMDSLYQSATASIDNNRNKDEKLSIFEQFVQEPCSPCAALKTLAGTPPRNSIDTTNNRNQQKFTFDNASIRSENPPLNGNMHVLKEVKDTRVDSPFGASYDRRKQRHANVVRELPVESLTVKKEDSYNLEKSISELTMKSSYGGGTAQLSENRRMAYYAVGKHHKNNGRGGNRRCYFTGKLILNGAPFYAGSVQQGLRTLVVFCLPSAVGLPKVSEKELQCNRRQRSDLTGMSFKRQSSDVTKKSAKSSVLSVISSKSFRSGNGSPGGIPLPQHLKLGKVNRVSTKTSQSLASISRTTSLDEMSFLEEELDKNWDVDRDFLLKVLPSPSQNLLDEMGARYPDQFETLPFQVRSHHSWRLFIKFCFFSGLPIAEGEMHYKVVDEVSSEVYGEEIVLSHEVMEAVNGEASAEILRLPNLKTFKYLRKHYIQQSAKLSDIVFQRTSWELVRPEV